MVALKVCLILLVVISQIFTQQVYVFCVLSRPVDKSRKLSREFKVNVDESY